MGNFYANLTVRSADTAGVAWVLDSLRRRGYVATDGDVTFVYDERADAQDLDELRRVAELVSRDCRSPVLAACNHDDDVLWLALAEHGRVADIYDSCPGYFDGGSTEPRLSDVGRLCAAFGAADREAEIESLLRLPRSAVVLEVERHRKLLRQLGVRSDAGLLGYAYVSRGELSGVAPAAVVRATGGAPEPGTAHARPAPGSSTGRQDQISELAAFAESVRVPTAALALGEIDVPEEFGEILGQGRVNAFVAFMRLQRYLASNSLVDGTATGGPVVRANALVERLLGVRETPYGSMIALFVDRLNVWESFSPEERRAIETDDPSMRGRIAGAMRWCAEQLLHGSPD